MPGPEMGPQPRSSDRKRRLKRLLPTGSWENTLVRTQREGGGQVKVSPELRAEILTARALLRNLLGEV